MATTLGSLLDSVARRLTAQEKVVEDLTAPLRELEALKAEKQRIDAEIAERRARLTQVSAELFDCRNHIKRTEPREAKIAGAIEVLDQLADDAMNGLSRHIDAHLLNRAWHQCQAELELLANARAERTRSEVVRAALLAATHRAQALKKPQEDKKQRSGRAEA